MNSTARAKLDKHHGIIRALRMVDLFDADPQRAEHFSIEVGPLFCDYSKNKIDDETMRLLTAWAQEQKLPAAIQALMHGKPLNTTEKRAALHTALRSPNNSAAKPDSALLSDVQNVQAQMKSFVENAAENGNYKSLINIGVGGSDLGPKMVCRALAHQADSNIQAHFVSNMDAHPLRDTLANCDPKSTLVIITSKSFTTLETLHNADIVKQWLVEALGEAQANQQLVAITAKPLLAEAYGINSAHIFPFWDWVGGRYSMWSAVGLSIALTLGWQNFEQMLQGAAAMDQHFAEAPLAENLPVILALLACWYRNWYGYSSQCMAPYEERLEYLVPYLQQLDMESNGKAVGRAGEAVSDKTGSIIWGQPGTNAQHAFFQWLHQGKDVAPVDFIVAKQPEHPYSDSHRLQLANAIAQAEALLTGKQAPVGQPYRQFDGNRPSNFLLLEELNAYSLGMLIALYEHKVFVQGWLWGINSFDQWGVELGKQLASVIDAELRSGHAITGHDCSTKQLINKLQ